MSGAGPLAIFGPMPEHERKRWTDSIFNGIDCVDLFFEVGGFLLRIGGKILRALLEAVLNWPC